MLKSYNSEKRLKTAPVQLRESVDDVTLAPRRPMTSYNTIAQRQSTNSSTKGSRNSIDMIRMQKTGWSERIGLPISTYNESVYPRYKILFDHL